jgi:hypothetical protein
MELSTEYKQQLIRDGLVQRMKSGIVEIEFTKKDGSTRVMRATLNEAFIPKNEREGGSGRTQNANLMSVYDVDADGWRSFNVSSLIDVRVPIHEPSMADQAE